jgi:transcriptional regulator with XRE-family HTH domain
MMPIEDARINESREVLKQEFQDEEYRYAYAEDFLNTWVASQIVTLREQRGLSQAELGELIGTKQPGVSRLENVNRSTWKTETLKKIAKALGVRLRISFETFSTLLDEDNNFSRKFLMRPTFDDDPGLLEKKAPGIASVNTRVIVGSTELSHYQTDSAPTTGKVIVFPVGQDDRSTGRYASIK